MKELSGEDLGVAGCDFVARGEAAGEVVELMVEHLQDEHGIDMPEPTVILDTYADEASLFAKLAEVFGGDTDKQTELLVQRIREELHLDVE